MPSPAQARVISAVEGAARRAAATVRAEMSLNVNSLATVASIAPLLGLAATVEGIVGSFRGCGAEKSACMAATVQSLSDSFITTALGLFVAVPAFWLYRYLKSEVDELDSEMKATALQLMNTISVIIQRPRPAD